MKSENPFISDITLEENIIENEVNRNSAAKIKKPKYKSQTGRTFQCDRCDKNYKFASGLHYHNKHGHKEEKSRVQE